MHLIAKVMKISQGNFHCNRLTTVQDIQDYAILGGTVHIASSDKNTMQVEYIRRASV